MLLLTALNRDGALLGEDESSVVIHLITALMNAMIVGVALLSASGKPERLYAYPISTPRLVAWQMLPPMTALLIEVVASAVGEADERDRVGVVLCEIAHRERVRAVDRDGAGGEVRPGGVAEPDAPDGHERGFELDLAGHDERLDRHDEAPLAARELDLLCRPATAADAAREVIVERVDVAQAHAERGRGVHQR